MTDHNDTGATARPWIVPAGEGNEHVICAGDDADKPGKIICILHSANFSYDRLSYDELTAVAAIIVEAVNAYEPLKARLVEVERERDEWKQAAGVEAQLRREFLTKANAAEARIAVLEKALAEVLDMYFPMSGPTAVKQPPLILEARTALAEQKGTVE